MGKSHKALVFDLAWRSAFRSGFSLPIICSRCWRCRLLRNAIVFAVMWAMGVTLQAETVRRSLAKPFPSLLAIAINVVAVPLLCLALDVAAAREPLWGLVRDLHRPFTLASASVWTRKAGGDDSIAMMTTVVTNLACVVVVPLGIWLVLSQQAEIDAVAQVKKLALLVVCPLILAQVMRRLGAGAWADRNRLPALAGRASRDSRDGVVRFGRQRHDGGGGRFRGDRGMALRPGRASGGDPRFIAWPCTWGLVSARSGGAWARESDCGRDRWEPENVDGWPADRDRLRRQRGSDDRLPPQPVGDRHDRRRSLEAAKFGVGIDGGGGRNTDARR